MDYTQDIISAVTRYQARKVRELTKHLPLNEANLPVGFWQTDVVLGVLHDWKPDDSAPQSVSTAISTGVSDPEDAMFIGLFEDSPFDEAWIELSYSEGFPTIPGIGTYFWDKLPGEAAKHFQCFQAYVNLPGLRTLVDLAQHKDIQALGLNFQALQNLFYLYYWELRSKSYDFFKEIIRQKNRLDAANALEAANLIAAQSLKNRVLARLENRFDELNGRELIDLYKTAIAVERISVGLNPNAPGSGKSTGFTAGVSGIQVDAPEGSVINIGQVNVQNNVHGQGPQNRLRQALRDPSSAGALQFLALKMQGADVKQLPEPVTPDVTADVSGNESSRPASGDGENTEDNVIDLAELQQERDTQEIQNRIFTVK